MVYVASMPDRPTAEALLISSSLNTGESLVGYRLVPSMFLGYQVYTLVPNPTIGMALLSVLDAIIIVLIYREYRTLTTRARPR